MISPFSKKRLAQIASGEVKLSGRSTVRRKSMAELIADGAEMRGQVINTIFGKKQPFVQLPADVRRRAKERAWTQFSMFVRLRDADEFGRAKCCTCGKRRYWREMDAGHYVTTAKEATKFDENNVHAQCKGCNKWQGGKPVEYEQFIDRKYGEGTALKIRNKSVLECRRRTWDYQVIEKNYRERVDWIKQHEPGKFKKP